MKKIFFIAIILTGIILSLTNSIWLYKKPIDVTFNINGNQEIKIDVSSDNKKHQEQKFDLSKTNELNFKAEKNNFSKTIKIVINSKSQPQREETVRLSDMKINHENIKADDLSKFNIIGANQKIVNNEIVLTPTNNEIILEYPFAERNETVFHPEWFLFFLILPNLLLFIYKKDTEKSDVSKRDKYLDTMKGLCVISIIFIHTCFHSGVSYVPLKVQNLSLMFDALVWFFLTGCLYSIKNDLNLFKQLKKMIYLFFIITVLAQILTNDLSLQGLLNPLFLNINLKNLESINMSYWFIPVYIICLLYTLLITKYCNKIVKYLFLILVPIYYIYSYCNNSILFISILGQGLQFILYYIWTMLLGFELYQKNNKKLLYLYCLIFISSLSYFFYNLIFVKNFSLQDYKFIVSLPYILCSLASLSFILIFKNKIKSNILSNIGSKAIYMYITQGIGGSFLIHYHSILPIDIWYLKLPICFVINLIISLSLGYLFYWMDSNLKILFEKTKLQMKK